MIEDITSAITGILSAITSLINPAVTSGNGAAGVAYVAILALPILGGTVAMARRLIKKSR